MNFKKCIILFTILLLSVTIFACNKTAFEDNDYIVEASQVEKVYKDGSVVIVDARSLEAYEAGHLLNAIHLPTSEIVVDTPVPNMLAPKAKVERSLSAAGITNDARVYIYDDNGGISAGRVWWTLKVYGHEDVKVINGGFEALSDLKLEGSIKVHTLAESNYVAKDAKESMMIDFESLKAITEDEDSKVKILDVRSLAEFEAGSIPGSTLFPHSQNLYNDGTFLSERDTYLFYKDKGFEKDDTIVLYCKTSFRAAQSVLVLKAAGYENLKIYDGAWLEWEMMGGESSQPEENAPITNQDGS
jgi:thiosulfate/3-mercaptopyruvate sulfurtransferase